MRNLAVIPARGGSKGVPRKNVRMIGGRPLVVHTILAAIESGVFDCVVVSTDDGEIAAVSRGAGAEVVQRPPELATDGALTEPVMAHALAELEKERSGRFDALWLLQPTSPLRCAEDIRAAASLLDGEEVDAVVSVCEDHSFFWLPADADTALIEPTYELSDRPRRQDMAPRYRENGALYAVKRDAWDALGVRAAGRIAPLVMSVDRSLEIDSAADFALVEATMRELDAGAGPAWNLPFEPDAVVFDFDGVFTDNKVIVSEDGVESAVCSRGDGWGIASLHGTGVKMVVISTEQNPVVARRCQKLRLECVQGTSDKGRTMGEWAAVNGVSLERTLFVGNDLNDVDCIRMAALSCAPSDAHPAVLPLVSHVLVHEGGDGAVREVCDLILQYKAEHPISNGA